MLCHHACTEHSNSQQYHHLELLHIEPLSLSPPCSLSLSNKSKMPKKCTEDTLVSKCLNSTVDGLICPWRGRFYTSESISRCWGVLLHMWKNLYKVFSISRESCVKSDKCPHMMSLESVWVGAEEVWKWKKSVQTSVDPHLCCRLEAPGYNSCH